MGPMAQDFREAFELGNSERTIGTVDVDGVTLTAIQALIKKMDDMAAKNAEVIEELAEQNARLKERVSELERNLHP